MIDRRSLLATGVSMGAALLAGPALAGSRGRRLKKIGLQLYTLRDLFSKDPMGTLERVARLGYREVEYGGGGYTDMDPTALRATMDRLGLRSPSIHLPFEMLRDRFDASVKLARVLGADLIVVPWMSEAYRAAAPWQGAIRDFNRLAGQLKGEGLGFAYHNHEFEFTVKDGSNSLFDLLIAERDPALVKIELDLFWAFVAGEDPVAVIRRLPGGIYSYHVKDATRDRKMTSVGNGVIDFASIFALNDLAGVQHFYVENDEAPAPYLPDVQASFTALRALRF